MLTCLLDENGQIIDIALIPALQRQITSTKCIFFHHLMATVTDLFNSATEINEPPHEKTNNLHW